MAITNSLNHWSYDGTNVVASGDLAETDNCKYGFQSQDYLISANFNTILKEVSLVTTSLINAVASIFTSATETIDVDMSVSDLTNLLSNFFSNEYKPYSASNADSATKATNLANGNAGSIPYQSAANTTTFLPIGAKNYILSINNSLLPVWKNPANISVGSSGKADETDFTHSAWNDVYPDAAITLTSGYTYQFMLFDDRAMQQVPTVYEATYYNMGTITIFDPPTGMPSNFKLSYVMESEDAKLKLVYNYGSGKYLATVYFGNTLYSAQFVTIKYRRIR